MAPDAKTRRSSIPGVGLSTGWGSWGAEVEELPEPLEVEASEDILNDFK